VSGWCPKPGHVDAAEVAAKRERVSASSAGIKLNPVVTARLVAVAPEFVPDANKGAGFVNEVRSGRELLDLASVVRPGARLAAAVVRHKEEPSCAFPVSS
jgi:hypothetical protein